jgi:hypothetical protein
MFISYFRAKHSANLSLSFVFFWIGLHAYAFAVPSIISPDNMNLLAFGYIIGIGMIFLTMLSGIEVQAFMAKQIVTRSSTSLASVVITIIGIVTLSIMANDFRLPIINEAGIIFWNINPIAAWLVSLSAFIYGIIWGIVFYRAALLVNDAFGRVKLMVMSADGFLIGSVALLVHTSSTEIQTVLGHSMFIVAGLLTLGIYLLPKKIFQITQSH